MGKKIKYSGWQGDKVIRLFLKSCRYEDKKVHAEIESPSKVGKLKKPHFTFHFQKYVSLFIKMGSILFLSAKDHFKKVNNPNFFVHFIIKPTFRFLRDFIFRGGILDGKTGYIVFFLVWEYLCVMLN